jgi:hypothetical protein
MTFRVDGYNGEALNGLEEDLLTSVFTRENVYKIIHNVIDVTNSI